MRFGHIAYEASSKGSEHSLFAYTGHGRIFRETQTKELHIYVKCVSALYICEQPKKIFCASMLSFSKIAH